MILLHVLQISMIVLHVLQLSEFRSSVLHAVWILSSLSNSIHDIYIYIYRERERERESAVLKRLTTPSDFHIPLPSIVPFAHSSISFIHGCIYSIFSGSPGAASFFPSFRFPVNHNFW
jgi:hypothetical protein